MNTDDLHDMLNNENPEGLDGVEMLRQAQHARTRRRLTGLGVGAVAAVTVFAMVFSGGLWGQPNVIPAGTPQTTSAATTPTSTPSKTGPTSTGPTSTSSPDATVAALCTPRNTLPAFTARSGLMAVGPGADLVVTSSGPDATVTRDGTTSTILSLPTAQGIMEAHTDGRFVVLLVALVANSDDPGKQVYVWDAAKGGQATRFVDTTSDLFHIQVRDGFAMWHAQTPQDQQSLHLRDLASGDQQVVHTGTVQTFSLLDGGTYMFTPQDANGVRVAGTGPAPRQNSTAGPVSMYPPMTTNGSSWAFFDAEDPGAGSMVIWSPAMPQPLRVLPANTTASAAQIGTNFALFVDSGGPWHLIDLRTGGQILLPVATESGPDSHYQLTVDDVLLRDPMDARSAGPEPMVQQAWVDLSTTTLTC